MYCLYRSLGYEELLTPPSLLNACNSRIATRQLAHAEDESWVTIRRRPALHLAASSIISRRFIQITKTGRNYFANFKQKHLNFENIRHIWRKNYRKWLLEKTTPVENNPVTSDYSRHPMLSCIALFARSFSPFKRSYMDNKHAHSDSYVTVSHTKKHIQVLCLTTFPVKWRHMFRPDNNQIQADCRHSISDVAGLLTVRASSFVVIKSRGSDSTWALKRGPSWLGHLSTVAISAYCFSLNYSAYLTRDEVFFCSLMKLNGSRGELCDKTSSGYQDIFMCPSRNKKKWRYDSLYIKSTLLMITGELFIWRNFRYSPRLSLSVPSANISSYIVLIYKVFFSDLRKILSMKIRNCTVYSIILSHNVREVCRNFLLCTACTFADLLLWFEPFVCSWHSYLHL